MEEKFYHPEKHIYSNDEEHLNMEVKEVQDSRLLQLISEDVSRKDIRQLRKHYQCLKEKYSDNTQYSILPCISSLCFPM